MGRQRQYKCPIYLQIGIKKYMSYYKRCAHINLQKYAQNTLPFPVMSCRAHVGHTTMHTHCYKDEF